jgi:hypothetical protein
MLSAFNMDVFRHFRCFGIYLQVLIPTAEINITIDDSESSDKVSEN